MRDEVVKRINDFKLEMINRRDDFNSDLFTLLRDERKNGANNTQIRLQELTNTLLTFFSLQEEQILNSTFTYRQQSKQIRAIYNETHSKAIVYRLNLLNYQNNKLNKYTYYDRNINL